MKISVILPIYNVEKYLRQSIDSIGLFDRKDVEIILVNDGSTDGCLRICQIYAQRYSNIVVVDKPNGGLSDARNAGVKIAKGEYIYFLDSDDWLAEGAIMKLYTFAIANDCQVVQGGFYYAYDDHLLLDNRFINENQEPFILTRDEAMLELVKNNYVKNFAWGKLYKASIVKQHQFPFGKYYEDSFWQHLIINETERYGVVATPLYYYRQRCNGISGEFSIKTIDMIEGNNIRLQFMEANYPELFSLMKRFYYQLVKNLYCSAMRFGDDLTRETYRNLLHDFDSRTAPMWFKIGKRYPFVLKSIRLVGRAKSHLNRKGFKRINMT